VRHFDRNENAGGNKGTPRSGKTLLEKDGLTKIGPSEFLEFEKLYSPTPDHQMKINICIFPRNFKLRLTCVCASEHWVSRFFLVRCNLAAHFCLFSSISILRNDVICPKRHRGSGTTHCATIATYNAIHRFIPGNGKAQANVIERDANRHILFRIAS
jgi:hypothetical protein